MRNREITSTYINRSTLALLVSLGFLAAVCAMFVLAPPSQAQVQFDEDNSINDSFNTDLTVQLQEQNCPVIIQQYNNAVAGDAVAAGDAVVATAAEVNAPVNIVQNCIQAGGDIVIGSGNDDGNNDGDDNDVVNPGDDGNDPGNDDGDDGSGGDDPGTGSCPNARELATLNGDGDTPDFNFTGDFIRIEGTYTGDPDLGPLFYLYDEDGDLAGDTEAEDSGPFASNFNVPPGIYYLTAETFDGSFEATLYDCTEESGERTENTSGSSSRESSVIPGTYNSGQVLAKTGGSTEGMISVSPVSAGLMSGGALLVLCGVGIAVRLGRIDFSGRE